MTKEEANKKLGEMVKAVNNQLLECEKFADEHGLEFSLYPAWGMGGNYIGANHPDRDVYFDADYTDAGEGEGFWSPSSTGC